MKQLISVVIPVLNEGTRLALLLDALVGDSEVELIVADGGSTDNTREMAARFPSVQWVASRPGRGLQMNCGARRARGEVLWFLHADSRVPPGWKSAISGARSQPGFVSGSFRLRFDHDHRLLRTFGLFSRINHPLFTYGDQGFFMPRAVFQAIGGFREFPFLEDVEIQSRLRRRGRWIKLDEELTTSARRFRSNGIFLQQLKNAGIVALFLLGASPFWLRRFYPPPCQARLASQSASLKPAALKLSESRKGRFTRLPLWLKSWTASVLVMLRSLSFRPKAR